MIATKFCWWCACNNFFSTWNVPSFNPTTGALVNSIENFCCAEQREKINLYLLKMDSGKRVIFLGYIHVCCYTYVCLCHADISNLSFYLFLTSLTYLWSVGLIFSLFPIFSLFRGSFINDVYCEMGFYGPFLLIVVKYSQ